MKLDHSIGYEWLCEEINKIDNSFNWTSVDLKYLVERMIILSEDDVRIVHMESAKVIIALFIKDGEKKKQQVLLKLIEQTFVNKFFPLLGIVWLCNGVRSYSSIYNIYEYFVTDKMIGSALESLSYVLSDNLKIDFVLLTIEQLVENHGISLSSETIIHSDQGVHYTSYKFIEIVTNSNLRQSMSRRGNCWDNAPQESFFGHMKDEIDLSNCMCFNDVKMLIDDWIDYYNNDRYQWQLAKLSPNEYYEYITTGVYPLDFQTE